MLPWELSYQSGDCQASFISWQIVLIGIQPNKTGTEAVIAIV